MSVIMGSEITFSDYIRVSGDPLHKGPIVVDRGQLRARSYDYKDLLGLRKGENQLVWREFNRAIIEEFGRKRVDRACKRYQIDPVQLENNGTPLDHRIVGLFRVFASEVFCDDLTTDSDQGVQWLPPAQIHRRVEDLREKSYLSNFDSINSFSACLAAPRFNEVALAFDENKALLWSTLFTNTYQSYLEVLSKRLGRIELEEGALLPAPSLHSEKEYYKVTKKIVAEGLVAYALQPVSAFSSLKPLLIFRPTTPNIAAVDAPLTWLNDFEIHIGSIGYNACKEQLTALINDPSFCPEGVCIDVAGFSWGGAHMQRFLADHWKKVGRAFSFNAPSVEASLAERFATELNAEPENARDNFLSIEVYRTRDDLAHSVGEKHLGWGVTHPKVQREFIEVDFVEREQLPTFTFQGANTRHVRAFFHEQNVQFVAHRHLQETIDAELNNTDATRPKFWERLHLTLGNILLFPLVYMVHMVSLCFHKYLHVSLFRYSAPRVSTASIIQNALPQRLFNVAERIS
ncbi:MAG: hypothetical protein NTX49_03910 [Chlamydiae bacterium]|nr:hypothetical protein [Chlamydiota bacterium]